MAATRTRRRSGERQARQGARAELPVDPREPVLDGVLAGRGGLERQRLQREAARRVQVADAMLVMDRERLRGLARISRRAAAHPEQLAPGGSRRLVAAEAAQQDG